MRGKNKGLRGKSKARHRRQDTSAKRLVPRANQDPRPRPKTKTKTQDQDLEQRATKSKAPRDKSDQ